MSVGNKALAYRWYEEVWNKKRADLIHELLGPDSLVYGLTRSATHPLRGPDEFKTFWLPLITALPDIHIAVESTVGEQDRVAARCSVRATHSGEGLGVSPTGRKITLTGMSFATFKDGGVLESWNNFDFLSLYRQLDLVQFAGPTFI